MRISSKFRDYYDGCASHDHEDLHWFRKAQLLPTPNHSSIPPQWSCYSNTRGVFTPITSRFFNGSIDFAHGLVLFFCGKLYFGIRMYKFKKGTDDSWSMEQDNYSASDSTYNCLPKSIVEGTVVCWNKKQLNSVLSQDDYKWLEIKEKTLKSLKEWLHFNDTNDHKFSFLGDLSVETKQPIITIERVLFDYEDGRVGTKRTIIDHTIQNPMLRYMDFQTIVDPYTALQELEMYVGGVIQNPDPVIAEVSDCNRARQHGFDEVSFRGGKEKSKHDWKREKKKNTSTPTGCKS